ncbi:FecR family protein [Mucilaginibacter aquariorum]|uniref:FecR family protein n=1 Tax=Mucilaginibacter aquariorum TaxID=2967225 RepID=A0ABT1T195_9SPHI|nr:FecR family protein [Mucilaginibacter aquariorum]MCQ6957758.1 FecR family protein [Mucilaginibacter aquariorum]
MMDEKSLNEFLEKYIANRHTKEEHELFIEWLNTAPLDEVQQILDKYQFVIQRSSDEEPMLHPHLASRIEEGIDALEKEGEQAKPVKTLWPSFKKMASIAAAFILIVSVATYFLSSPNGKKQEIAVTKPTSKNQILPGGNKAVLTLADGSHIILGDAQNGILAKQANIDIRKAVGGKIVYNASNQLSANAPALYNTITTPRGGQYQVTLSDGSKVWLNAASSLKFPAAFSNKERVVELTGEAYFEIAKLSSPSVAGREGNRIPFKVITNNQTVEVLGTHFNINAYADEAAIKTTLLEGSVKVVQSKTNNSQLLKPGQQAMVGTQIQIADVDATLAIAWKNGYFIFSHEDIGSIMRQISRWYDINIQYEGNVTQERFVGTISRFNDVAQILDVLQLTGAVHFKTENDPAEPGKKRIIVMP